VVHDRPAQRLAGAAQASLRSVVGPPAVFGGSALPADFGSTFYREEMEFAFASLLFSEALAAGWSWGLTLCLFAGLHRGRPCEQGRGFIPERGKAALPGSRWLVGTLCPTADPSTVAIVFFDEVGVVFVRCTRMLFGPARRVRGPLPSWLVALGARVRPDGAGRGGHAHLPLPQYHLSGGAAARVGAVDPHGQCHTGHCDGQA
jgi:hypothetical protein